MIFDKLKEVVANQFGLVPEEVTMDSNFITDFNADSIDIVEVMMAVEDEFNLGEVDENALEHMKTVGDVVEYIKDHI